MRRSRHTAGLAVLVTLPVMTSIVGCKRKPLEAPVIVSQAAPSVSSLPIDTLAPGELAEGTVKVYGLMLPRAFRVQRQFDGVTYCSGQGRPEQVSNYVRRRVDARTVELGPARTVFPAVQVLGVDGGPKLRIEVAEGESETELIIRDVTPPPLVPGLTEEERWRRVGMKPGGGLLDRDHTF